MRGGGVGIVAPTGEQNDISQNSRRPTWKNAQLFISPTVKHVNLARGTWPSLRPHCQDASRSPVGLNRARTVEQLCVRRRCVRGVAAEGDVSR